MEDPEKVQSKILELNATTPGKSWVPYVGYHALTSVEFVVAGAQFKPNAGVVVKAFMNTVTYEIRVFPYTIFERKSA